MSDIKVPKMPKIRRLRGVVVLGAALAIAVAGVASAAIPSANGTIYACYDKQSGQARLYDPAANLPKACGPKEASVSWNAQGAPGQDGTDGTDGTDGVSGYVTVTQTSDEDSFYDKTVFATCPAGKQALGGGAGVYGHFDGFAQEIIFGVGLVQDHPFSTNGWAARATEFVPTDSDWYLFVEVICADVN